MEMNISCKCLWCICFQMNKDKMSTMFDKDILLIHLVETRKGKNETSQIISPLAINSR